MKKDLSEATWQDVEDMRNAMQKTFPNRSYERRMWPVSPVSYKSAKIMDSQNVAGIVHALGFVIRDTDVQQRTLAFRQFLRSKGYYPFSKETQENDISKEDTLLCGR